MAAAFVFQEPTDDYQSSLAADDVEVDSVMTASELAEIQARAANAHATVTAAQWSEVFFDMAVKMSNNGSSEATKYRGATHGIDFMELCLYIQRTCTRRQFAAYFAKLVFNYHVRNQKPPAKWQKFNFTQSTRYCGFDFSFAITSEAAVKPTQGRVDELTGLVRDLSQDELAAIEANRAVHIHRRNLQAREQSSTAVEITGGRVRSGTGVYLPPPS